MNKLFPILLVTIFTLCRSDVHAQQREGNQITFKVSDVELPETNLHEASYKQAIESRISRVIEGYDIENENTKLVPTGFNAFVASIHFAYADHRPLIISPDMIWLTLCQGFSIHVNENAEKLRLKIVNHQGKKEIVIMRHDFRKGENNPWAETFETFTDSIKKYIKDDLYDLMVADFTTTTLPIRAAYQITLMEGTKKYFEGMYDTGCGIPEITLEGTVADWEWIRAHVDQFRKYDLEIWVDNLIPVLDEFVAASKGEVNKSFWETIYKVSEHYMPVYSTGWILKLFPYYQVWKYSREEGKHYKYTDYIPNPYYEGENYRLSRLTTENFPNGVSKFPFVWKYEVGDVKEEYNMEIYGGFMGVKQNKTTKSVRAEISWAIRDEKSSWTSNVSKGVYVSKREPYDYFYTREHIKPHFKPIFLPGECKIYEEGVTKLKKYIEEEVVQFKAKQELNGKVSVNFAITWQGTIADVQIPTGTGEQEALAAKEIILGLPKWKPARQYGQINVEYTVSFRQAVTIDFDK